MPVAVDGVEAECVALTELHADSSSAATTVAAVARARILSSSLVCVKSRSPACKEWIISRHAPGAPPANQKGMRRHQTCVGLAVATSKLVSVEGPRWEEDGHGLAVHVVRRLTYRAAQLLALLLSVATLLFILVRLSASPAALLAGAGASQAQVQAARAAYGLDGPMLPQYITFMVRAFRLDFGQSPAHQTTALELVRLRLPATLLLTAAALAATAVVAVSLGVWLGLRAERPEHGWAFRLLLTGQSLPALVIGLVLVQASGLTPSAGAGSPLSFVLSALTLTWWLAPRLARLTAGAVAGAARQAWVLTARAMGATSRDLVWGHVLPNSLLAAFAMVGVQVAFLLSATVVVEWLFGWPGVGDLLAGSVRAGDFPVVEAAIFAMAFLVFATYATVDLVLAAVDPRHRGRPTPR